MSSKIRIENDDVVEVGGDVGEAFDDLVDILDEPFWRRAASLWHDKPVEEALGRAESREGDRVLVDRGLMERREQIKEGKYPAAALLPKASTTRVVGSCPTMLVLSNFL